MHRRRRKLSDLKNNKDSSFLLEKIKKGAARRKKKEKEVVNNLARSTTTQSESEASHQIHENVIKPKSTDMIMLDDLLERQRKKREKREAKERGRRISEYDKRTTDLKSSYPNAFIVNINFGGGLFDLFEFAAGVDRGLSSSSYFFPSNYTSSGQSLLESWKTIGEKKKGVTLAGKSKLNRKNQKKYMRPEKAPAKRRNPPRPKHGCNRQNYGWIQNKKKK